MLNTLIDAGPLIALFDRNDQYHRKAVSFIKTIEGQLWTTWPVVTEVMHMLDFHTKAQINFMTWIERGGLKLGHIQDDHLIDLIDNIIRYDEVPMDLADATLMLLSQQIRCSEIATIDSDFYIYRDVRNKYLQNVFI